MANYGREEVLKFHKGGKVAVIQHMLTTTTGWQFVSLPI